ncbi:MAG: hypothetical protein K0S32_2488 [Bacteroidetes bacterium]|jgi:hypothetical protein|nr:hypothetical protein [Bacteroidota bacterium]
MVRELEIQFQERAINVLLREMHGIFDLLIDPDAYPFANPDFTIAEVISEKKREFNSNAVKVYNMTLVYLEMKNVPLYIHRFKEKISPYYEDMNALPTLNGTDIYGVEKCIIVEEYRKILYPFRAFGGGEEKYLARLDILENILENTGFILRDRNIIPDREAVVYNAVKIVCEATFPGEAQFDGGHHPFYQQAKCYKPDILIPYLNCAVEYKFAKTETDLIRTIDEILSDVPGYSNHSVYKLFYAVFYVKTGIIQKKKFSEVWRSKGFPENWKEIIVEGDVQ